MGLTNLWKQTPCYCHINMMYEHDSCCYIVNVTYDSMTGAFNGKFVLGTITHGDCGDLNSY